MSAAEEQWAAGVTADPPGPLAGYLFGKLAGVVRRGPASVFTVVLPAAISASLRGFFDMQSMRST